MESEWKYTTLDEIADIIMGQSPKGDTCNSDNIGTPLLNGPTEFGSKYPKPTQFTIDSKRLAKEGDILFCVRGSTTGRMNWANQTYAIGRGLASIHHKKGKEYQAYLKAVVDYYLPKLLIVATGSTFPNVSKDQLNKLEIKIPSIQEQKSIAHILGSLDDKIELNRQMNQTLEQMAQALFKSWFVDFDPVIDNVLAAGNHIPDELKEKAERRLALGDKRKPLPEDIQKLFPSSFVFNEELDKWIPEGWRVGKISDFTSTIQYGYTQSSSTEQVGPAFLRITDIQGGIVSWEDVPFCEINEKDKKKYLLETGDIVVARTGASTGENTYIHSPPNAVFASYLVRFKFEDISISRIVGVYLRTKHYRDFIKNILGGSAQPNANAQQLSSALIIIPKNNLARKFYELVKTYDNKKRKNEESINHLTKLRDTLLPKLIIGEVRV